MALLGFQDRFVPKVENGTKTHTIRALRAHPIRVGETLHLYAKPRQMGMRLIFRAPCTHIQSITISDRPYKSLPALVHVDGMWLSRSECELLAVRDGFADFVEFVEFWRDRRPFDGEIIHWNFDARVSK